MRRKQLPLPLSFCLLLLASCNEYALKDIPEQAQGLAPVYLPSDWQDIRTELPQTLVSPVQTIRRAGFLFILDDRKGIHLIDNTQSNTLNKIGFLKIPGCRNMALYGDHLYVNNFHDLLIFQIRANADITLEKRLANAFEMDLEATFPTHHAGYFECVDEARRPVVDWQFTTLINPQCWR